MAKRISSFGLAHPPPLMLLAANAIEDELAEACRGIPPFLNCKPRAAVASALLSRITGRRWLVQGGRFATRTGRAPSELIGWTGADGGNVEWHAWACLPLDVPLRRGSWTVSDDRVMVFDAGIRHVASHATALGGDYRLPRLPLLYGTARALAAAGFWFEADADGTAHVLRDIDSIRDAVDTMSARAEQRFVDLKITTRRTQAARTRAR